MSKVTVEHHTLDSVQCQFAIKSLSSVLRSGSATRNFNKSRPIYVILWEIRNNYWTIWFMKNSKCQHFLFLKKHPQKWTNFLPSKDRYFSITKLDILIFCNILHLEMGFWNLSWKRIVSSINFSQKLLEVGKIKKSEFQKLYVWRPGNRKQSFFHNLNILSANWILLKICNSIKPNFWYLRSLERLAIKMWFAVNFANNLKDRHFVGDGSKNLKLSPSTCFDVSFQKNVLSSFLLFWSVCYWDGLSNS